MKVVYDGMGELNRRSCKMKFNRESLSEWKHYESTSIDSVALAIMNLLAAMLLAAMLLAAILLAAMLLAAMLLTVAVIWVEARSWESLGS